MTAVTTAAAIPPLPSACCVQGMIVAAVWPVLVRAGTSDRATLRRISRRALEVILLTQVPIAVGLVLLADRTIVLIGYPPAFSQSVAPLTILALHLPIAAANTVIGATLFALDRQRTWALVAVAAAVANPALNLALIPWTQHALGNGGIAAAVVTAVMECLILGAGLSLLRGEVFGRHALSYTLKCTGAAAFMAIVVLTVRDLSFPLSVALGALAYAACAMALRLLTPRDLRLARDYAMARVVRPTSA